MMTQPAGSDLPSVAATVSGVHKRCEFSWCTAEHDRNRTEHWSADDTMRVDEGCESTEIHVWTLVDTSYDYDDEIIVAANVNGARVLDVALTSEQAAQVRDALDAAIRYRAEARSFSGHAEEPLFRVSPEMAELDERAARAFGAPW